MNIKLERNDRADVSGIERQSRVDLLKIWLSAERGYYYFIQKKYKEG